MGIASLILGILALLASWIPIFGFLWIPGALVGIILGAVSVAGMKNKEDKSQQGVSIAGLIVSIVALLSIVGFTIFWATVGDDHIADVEDLKEFIEEQGAQPANVSVLSGHIVFQTLAYDCQIDALGSSASVSICSLDFQVTNTGPEDIVFDSTDQKLIVGSANSSSSTITIDATGGDCVHYPLAPGEVKVCQTVFTVPSIYNPQFASYTQNPESTPSRLVILPMGEVPGLSQ